MIGTYKPVNGPMKATSRICTEYCRDLQVKLNDDASKRNVELLESNHPIYRARVESTFNASIVGYVEVVVDLDRRGCKCPCRHYEEIGIACAHVKALLLTLNRQSSWCDKRYGLSNYKESYNCSIPSMVVAGKLTVDETLTPPDFRRPAGRPAKKRKDRSFLKKTDVVRECKACGQTGHYAVSCTAPSTEYRYNRYRAGAVEWCRQAEKSFNPE
jgi:hypothetical protein